MTDAISPPKSESKAGAGAAGIGGGTLLVVVANSLPENSKFKPWLLLATPSVSVFLGALWLWLQVRLLNMIRDREVNNAIEEMRRTIDKALNNSKTSEKHRIEIRRRLEELELVAVNRSMEKIKALKVISEEDYTRSHNASDVQSTTS